MSGDPKHPELLSFTFENGVHVWLRKVPPMLINKLNRSWPPPDPPLQPVDFGDGQRMEPNPTHPDHIRALGRYYDEHGDRIHELLIRVSVKYELTEQDLDDLKERRDQMLEMGIELPSDPKVAFITCVCIGSQEESDALRRAILMRTHPTEEAIADAVMSFRGDIRGPGHIQDQGAEERDEIREPAGVGASAAMG